ncbi:MAG: cadherin-like domain-containing protein [Lautropia sp.]
MSPHAPPSTRQPTPMRPDAPGQGGRRSRARRRGAIALEQRVLYSADLGIAAMAGIADAPTLDATHAAESPAPIATMGDAPGDIGRPATRADPRIDVAASVEPTPAPAGHQVLVVDAAVPDAERLADAVIASMPDAAWHRVLLEPGGDAIAQIGRALDALPADAPVAALHLFTHGGDAEIRLGSMALDVDSLAARATGVAGWRPALEGAELRVYGCEVAASAEGRALVDALGRLTGATVLASTDVTGSADRQGDWDLEYRSDASPPATEVAAATLADAAAAAAPLKAVPVAARLAEGLAAAGWSGRLAPGDIDVSTSADLVDVDLAALQLQGADAAAWLALNPGADGAISLREAVLAANVDADRNTIWVPAGVYALTRSGTDDDAIGGDLDLNQAVEIRGLGAAGSTVVDGLGAQRLFDVHGIDATLANLTLRDGNDGSGGAVSVDGAVLTIDDLVFTGNRATGLTGQGGAIAASDAEVRIAGSRFEQNAASGLLAQGGAIAVSAGSLSIRDSVFGQNASSLTGGAIRAAGASSVAIVDTEVVSNEAGLSGGGVAVLDVDLLSLDGVLVRDNRAASGGGVDISHFGSTPSTVTLDRSRISGNEASGLLGDGGGLRIVGTGPVDLAVDAALFDANKAGKGSGGAIHLARSGGTARIVNSTFTDNEAQAYSVLATTATISVDHATIADNRASTSGGVLGAPSGSPEIRLANTLFHENDANQTSAKIVSEGFNAENADRLGLNASGDRVDLGGALQPQALADNNGDGLVESMALSGSNPAIDGADASSAVGVDQRGAPRSSTDPSVGAFEFTDAVVLTPVSGRVEMASDLVPVDLFADLILHSDDANRKIVDARIEVGAGAQPGDTLSADTTASLVPTAPGASVTIGGLHQLDKYQQALRTVRFASTAAIPAAGDRTIVLSVTDEDGLVTTATRVVGVPVHVDQPPVIDSDGGGDAATLHVVEDDASTLPITTVSWSDPDTLAAGTVSLQGPDAARFTVDASNRLAFVSAVDYESALAVAAGRSWIVDVVVDSGGLTDTQRLSVVVDDLAPVVATPSSVAVAQGASVGIASAQLHAVDAGVSDASIVWRLDLAPTQGTLREEGTPLAPGAHFTQQALLDGRLTYEHGGGAVAGDAFTVSVGTLDAAGVASLARTVDVTVGVVVDLSPVFDVAGPLTVGASGIAPITSAVLHASDPDEPDPAAIVLTLVAPPTNGEWQRDGVALTTDETFTQADVDGGRIQYRKLVAGADSDAVSLSVGAGANVTGPVGFDIALANTVPVFTSPATQSVAENAPVAGGVAAADADTPAQALHFSLTGGADAALVTVDPASGVLRWVAPPDFEAPGDANGDNVYELVVAVGDGRASATQSLAVAVTDVDEPPTFTAYGPMNVAPGATRVVDAGALNATDPDSAAAAVQLWVLVAPTHGELLRDATVLAAGDRFTLAELVAGRIAYRNVDVVATTDTVEFGASNGVPPASAGAFTIAITGNTAPVFTSPAGVTRAENAVLAHDVSASDDGLPLPLRFAIAGGADAARFTIDTVTGRLDWQGAGPGGLPDREAPTDADADNVYELVVSATDGVATTSQTIAVTVTDVDEPPSVTAYAGFTVAPGETRTIGASALAAIDVDSPDSAIRFWINQAPAHGDLLRDGVALTIGEYFTQAELGAGRIAYRNGNPSATDDAFALGVSNGGAPTSHGTLAVTIAGNAAPTITSASGIARAENAPLAHVVTATDDGLPAPLVFAVVGGADASSVRIDAATGRLDWALADPAGTPDFELPADADADNVYQIRIAAGDGLATTFQDLSISVSNVDEPPQVAGARTLSVRAGEGVAVDAGALRLIDPDTAADAAFFVVVDPPVLGSLTLDGVALSVGDTFTLAAVSAGRVRYVALSGAAGQDTIGLRYGDASQILSTPTALVVTVSAPPTEPPLPGESAPPAPNAPSPSPAPVATPAPAPASSEPSPPPLADAAPGDRADTDAPVADGGRQAVGIGTVVAAPGAAGAAPSSADESAAAGAQRRAEAPAARAPIVARVLPERDRPGTGEVDAGAAIAAHASLVARDDPFVPGPLAAQAAERPITKDGARALATWSTPDRQRVAALRALLDRPAATRALDALREQVEAPPKLSELTVGASTAVAGGFSVGYVLWILRGGVLLSGLLSSMPAWQVLDPTPILGAGGARRDDDRADPDPDPDDADAGIDRLFSRSTR